MKIIQYRTDIEAAKEDSFFTLWERSDFMGAFLIDTKVGSEQRRNQSIELYNLTSRGSGKFDGKILDAREMCNLTMCLLINAARVGRMEESFFNA